MNAVVLVDGVLHQPRRRASLGKGGAGLCHYRSGELPLRWPTVCTGDRGIVYRYSGRVFGDLPRCETCATETPHKRPHALRRPLTASQTPSRVLREQA